MASLLINCTSRLRLAAAKPNRCQIAPLSDSSPPIDIFFSGIHIFSFRCLAFPFPDCNCVALVLCNSVQLFLRRTVDGDCRPTLCAPADRAAARNSVLGRNVLMGTQQTHAYHQADCIHKSTNIEIHKSSCPGPAMSWGLTLTISRPIASTNIETISQCWTQGLNSSSCPIHQMILC